MVSPGAGDGTSDRSLERGTAASEDVTGVFPKLLERMPAIIYIADLGPDGRWVYVSPQIEAILGYTSEEWLADPTMKPTGWTGRRSSTGSSTATARWCG